MQKTSNLPIRLRICLILAIVASFYIASRVWGQERKTMPPAVPIQVSVVQKKMVQGQIAIIGTTEPLRESVVASEVSGLVEAFW